MLDRSGVEAIRENQAFDVDNVRNTDIPAAVIPQSAELKSLEHLMAIPARFKADFNTHIPRVFTDYCTTNLHPDSVIYIDTDEMTAKAIFDHGNADQPEWATHRASIALRKKPAYEQLLNRNDRLSDQQSLIDFLSDWKEDILLLDNEDKEIDFQTAINRIRKLTINKNSSAEFEQGDYNHKASAMESVEIKSGEDKLPAFFMMNITPYEGFNVATIRCTLRAKTDIGDVVIKYRIDSLEAIKEGVANEFRGRIGDELPDTAKIYIGTMSLR